MDLALHVIGVIIIIVGLILFTFDQVKGSRAKSDDAGVSAWSVKISGPPALVLVVVGIAVLVLPLWLSSGNTVTPVTTVPTTASTGTTTTSTTTTTVAPPFTLETVFPNVVIDPNIIIGGSEIFRIPGTPLDWFSDWDFQCDGDAIYLITADNFWDGFLVITEVYTFDGQFVDSYSFEVYEPTICVWDFWYDVGLVHTLNVYAFSEGGGDNGVSLFIEWFS
jgi:hypothetical protein